MDVLDMFRYSSVKVAADTSERLHFVFRILQSKR